MKHFIQLVGNTVEHRYHVKVIGTMISDNLGIYVIYKHANNAIKYDAKKFSNDNLYIITDIAI